MIIRKIRVVNFGPHKDTEIILDKDITAIIGGNGNGKTFLVESIPAVLFGEFPSRSGSIIDYVTQGYTGDAGIQVEFSINNREYLAERKIRKTAKSHSQDAFLFEILPDKSIIIAGPKIKDFEDAIVTLLGDPKIFFASAFSAQNNVGDIVECSPTDRKKILSTLLNLDHFQEKSELFLSEIKTIEPSILKSETEISTLESMKVDVDINRIDLINIDMSELESQIEAQNIYINKKRELRVEIKAQILAAEENNRNFTNISQNIDKLTLEKVINIKNIDSLGKNVEMLSYFKGMKEKREQVLINNDKIQKYNTKVYALEEENRGINRKIDGLTKTIREMEHEKKSTEERFVSKRNNLVEKTRILESNDFKSGNCGTCRFLSTAIDAKKELESMPKEADTREHFRQIEKLLVEIEQLKVKIVNDIPGLNILESIPPDYSSEYEKALVAEQSIKGIEEKNILLESRIIELKEELEAKNISTNICDLTTEIEKIDQDITTTSEYIQNGMENISQYKRNIDKIKADFETNTKIDNKITDIIASMAENNKKLSILKYISNFYGRKGVQALLIDNAIPQLQNISDELMGIATEGRMRIEFSTVKENKDGSQRESLEILCTDSLGTRDISTMSGGEQKVLRNNIRLTLAIFQSQQSKNKLETLILDEPLDAMDIENSTSTILMLKSLDRYFKRVVFISHSDELLSSFENKLELVKVNGITKIKGGE